MTTPLSNLRRFTKTFTETRYYQRAPEAPPTEWTRLPQADQPLDDQVKAWVDATGAMIVHPGQVGIHVTWYDSAMTLRATTLGLTVLYIEVKDVAAANQPSPALGVQNQTGPAANGAGGATTNSPGAPSPASGATGPTGPACPADAAGTTAGA